MNPVISICCITFNHESFIRQCLEGFLMQKTNFEYEILIHDDASTDATQEIIKEYEKKYPEIIKPIYQKENQYSKGVRGMNQRFNFPRAKGKYIAVCEGDDYWTDPLKLQRQIDLMEDNPKIALSAENSKVIDKLNNIEKLFSNVKIQKNYNIKDLLNGRKFHTASIVFVKDKLHLPENYSEFPIGDTLLFISLASQGVVHYNPRVSSIYRLHNAGATRIKNRLKWAQTIERFYLLLHDFLDKKYSFIIYKTIFNHYYASLYWSYRNRLLNAFIISLFKYAQYYIKIKIK